MKLNRANGVIQNLYDSGIKFRICPTWDNKMFFSVGYNLNGWGCEKAFISFKEGNHYLKSKAIELYPESEFAKLYKDE